MQHDDSVTKSEYYYYHLYHLFHSFHIGRRLGKYATVNIVLTYLISTSFLSYESTLYSSFYLKVELRYIKFIFSAAILEAMLENMQLLLLLSTHFNSSSFISYESTLYSSLYLKAELRYIRIRFFGGHLDRHLEFSYSFNS